MKVRFIGTIKRTNTFGMFEPNKVYDVSAETGEQLLSVPTLFKLEEAGKTRKKNAKDEVIDVTNDTKEGDKYEVLTIKELMAEARQRGIDVKRGMRKASLIELLVEEDKKVNVEDD